MDIYSVNSRLTNLFEIFESDIFQLKNNLELNVFKNEINQLQKDKETIHQALSDIPVLMDANVHNVLEKMEIEMKKMMEDSQYQDRLNTKLRKNKEMRFNLFFELNQIVRNNKMKIIKKWIEAKKDI